MVDDQTIDRARKNGISAGLFVGPSGRGVNVDHLVNLLKSAAWSGHPGVRRAASFVLREMGGRGRRWRVAAGPKSGGIGDAKRGIDANYHITIRVSKDLPETFRDLTADQMSGRASLTEDELRDRIDRGTPYHLQLTPAGFIRAITGDTELEETKPSVPPGAAPARK